MMMEPVSGTAVPERISAIGRRLALAGIVLPLLMIGALKFTAPEIEAITMLIAGTPWLRWLLSLLGEAGTSYFLGIVEICAALLLIAAPWSPRAGVAGAALAAITFVVTCTLLALPGAWDPRLGGFPALGPLGQFLIKDIALLGVALFVLGESLAGAGRAIDR